jgi:hypothetical protein
VLVSPGTYAGTGNRDILIDDRHPGICVRSSSGAAVTTIDAQASPADRHSGFVVLISYSAQMTIEGFTITHAWASHESSQRVLAGGGIFCTGAWLVIRDCVFTQNGARMGGAVFGESSYLVLSGCTMVANWADWYGTIASYASDTVVENTLVAFGLGIPAVGCVSPTMASGRQEIQLSCCDIYGNDGGDWIDCISDQLGHEGNFAADPLFCDRAHEDFTVTSASPCVPGQHPDGSDCGWIGALTVGCEPTAIKPVSLGQLKRLFPPRPK